jgi:adhesin/invasin
VTARDANGGTISGAGVTLTASGSGNTLTPASGTTDATGVFTSTFTSTAAGSKTISANINGTAVIQTAPVSVNPSAGGGDGAILHTLLTTGSSSTNQKVYTTSPVSPAPNALVTIAVRSRRSGGPVTPTITGGGMGSWTQIASVDYDVVATPLARLVVFRAMSPTPASGPIIISYASSVSNAEWVVSQWTGVDEAGTNGAGAIGQTGSANGNAVSSLATLLAPFGNAGNVALGVLGAATNGPTAAPGSGFMEIAEPSSGESTLLETQWGTNLNTVTATLGKSADAGLLAIELVAGAAGGTGVSASRSTVSATSPITAGGSASLITVTVTDGDGNPLSGVAVTLSASGSTTVIQPASPTDAYGKATGTLSATAAGPRTVTAVAGGVTLGQQPVVTVFAGPVDAATSTIGAIPSSILAGSGTSLVTVTVRDAFGNPIDGSAVLVSAPGMNV